MALALVTLRKDLSRRNKHLIISATPSGSYATGGDTVDLTKLTNPKFISNGLAGAVPKAVEIINTPGGYSAEFIIGTTLANSKLKIYSAPGTELSAAAYPAALTSNAFQIELVGPLGGF